MKKEQIELVWNKAIEEEDVVAMAEFMSDDWILFSGDGNIVTTKIFLDLVDKGDLAHTEMDFGILDVKIFDDTYIILSKGTSSGIWKKQPFINFEITPTVFIKQNEKWPADQTMLAPANKE